MKNETKRKTLSPAIARVGGTGAGAAYGSTRRKSLTEATHGAEHGQYEEEVSCKSNVAMWLKAKPERANQRKLFSKFV